MFKIIKNISSEVDIKGAVDYVSELSKNISIRKGEDDLGNFLFQRLTHNQIMSSNSIRNLLFNDKLLKKIKETVGEFYFINFVSGKINSFGTKTHRDGQSFGYNYEGIKKSSKIFKVLFYLNIDSIRIPDGFGLDLNVLDVNLKNIFFNKKVFMKVNYYYEHYFRKKMMKSLKLSSKDVVLMDNNCWHRGSINKQRPVNEKDYKIKKILLDYEIATEKQAALDYAVYVRNYFINVKRKVEMNKDYSDKIDQDLLNDNYKSNFEKNNIKILNV